MDHSIFQSGLSLGQPFCDWLDVTCSPDASFVEAVDHFLATRFVPAVFQDEVSRTYQYGAGKLKLIYTGRFHKVSLSGGVLEALRASGDLEAFLMVLSAYPHSITRLDAAQDFSIDGPEALRYLEARYPNDRVNLSRKAMRVNRNYSARESDLQLTGTWYVGHRSKAKTTARVYDKSQEVFDKTGLMLAGKVTRIEITVKKAVGACLRDVADPERIFYHVASPALLPRPASVMPWSALDGYAWSLPPRDDDLTVDDFRRRVELSPDVDRLAKLASAFGEEGVAIASRIFAERVRSYL